MEAEVAPTVMEDSKSAQVESLQGIVKTSENTTIPCNESSPSSSLDSINMMETQAVSTNKSGASPKSKNKTTTTNSLSDATAVVGTIPSDGQYFFEDEVFRIDKKGRVKFGLIMETSSEEDGYLDKGDVRVVWYPKGDYTKESENSIGLADRTLMPGDVVRRLVPGKETQRGYCRDINMRADVKVLGTKYAIKNVNAERLRCVTDWESESTVCLDSWVGSIRFVEKKAVLRSANGCRIEISSKDFFNFDDPETLFSPHVIFAGNEVVGILPPMEDIKILTPEIPLITNRKGKKLRRKFTVESVVTEYVTVYWQCKALSDETNLQSITIQPDQCVKGEDLKRLKRLNLFESCMLQLKDRNILTFSSCDTIMKKSDWDIEQSMKFKLVLQKQKEDNHKIFLRPSLNGPVVVGGGGGSVGNVGNGNNLHHHYDKYRKKLSLGLDDKSANKLKKNLIKGDKFGSANKDKTMENTSNRNQSSLTSNKDDNEWISTDDSEDDGDGGDCDEEDVLCDFAKSVKNFHASEDAISTTTTISTCTSPSPRTSPKHLSKRQVKKKARKNFRKPSLCEAKKEFCPKEGDELITEAMLVYSTATVVWQDGTVECDIPSTQLYPIHHLDNHEFFPGDFVISGTEDSEDSYRDYGVIQTVDHEGRIANVKWFTTYTSPDEPKPSYQGASENSVYDLKDHPDFQYRPGTMVIRVANFVGEDAHCTAGQIIDNYTDGRIKVWWVDGPISMCWPQDLFEVGQYDQDYYWGTESEDSWETESENSEFGGGGSTSLRLSISESHILLNIERARVAIARLEEIFNISPNLQNPEVMRKLLTVYKGCRYLDRLMNTNFFHEDYFMGLIERVRRGGNQSIRDRMQCQKNRLFNDGGVQTINSPSPKQQHYQYSAIVAVNSCGQKPPPHQSTQQLQSFVGLASKEYAPKVLFNISSTPFKCSGSSHTTNSSSHLSSPSSNTKKRCFPVAAAQESPEKKSEDVPTTEENTCDNIPAETTVNAVVPQFEISPNKNKQYKAEKHQLLNTAMLNIEKAFEKTKTFVDGSATSTINNVSTSQDDSGNYSRNENCDGSSTSCTSSSDLTNIDTNNSMAKTNDNQKSISGSSIEFPEDAAPELVCVRLCTLLKDQLAKCIEEIRIKYYKEDTHNLSDVVNIDELNVATMETVIDIEGYRSENGEHLDGNVIEDINPTKVQECPESSSDVEVSANGLTATNSHFVEDNNITVDLDPRTLSESIESFQILSNAPKTHKFHLTIFHPNNTQQYYKSVQKEHRMLKNSLPPGVWVRAFEDRMDLLSVMIEGPKKTPYEDGMFLFDMQLGRDYPKNPPLCHYISYCSDRLNPNLYEDGKVCVSLLGTWNGTDTEVWGPKSSLLQVIVSIQGLILVSEPYFNEAGYEKQKDTQQGTENSRMYNEMVMIKMVQATTKLIQNPPNIFRNEILNHFKQHGLEMYERIKGWLELSKETHKKYLESEKISEGQYIMPDFPLVPASRGFCLTIAGLLENLKKKLCTLENVNPSVTNSSDKP